MILSLALTTAGSSRRCTSCLQRGLAEPVVHLATERYLNIVLDQYCAETQLQRLGLFGGFMRP
jgi:hypothetical protein